MTFHTSTLLQVKAVVEREAEFAGPAWMFGNRSFQLLPDGRLLAKYSDPKAAGTQLSVIDPKTGSLTDLQTPYSSYSSLSVTQVS